MRTYLTGPRLARVVLAGLVLVAVAAPWVAPYDPQASVGPHLAPPSWQHLLGTTPLGQDVVSRLVWGARASLSVAAGVVVVSLTLGVAVGCLAGMSRGVIDAMVCRVVDLVLAVPRLPLLIVLATMAPRSQLSIVLIWSGLAWAPLARVVRAQVLSLREAGYIRAAVGLGAGFGHVLRRHLLPALSQILAAQAVSLASGAILAEATLAFLGLAPVGTVSWGGDLHRTLSEPGVLLSSAWSWWAIPMGAAITITIGTVMCLVSTDDKVGSMA